MFGLPTGTTLLVLGVPLAWMIYTAVFYLRTRNWEQDDGSEGDGS